MIRKPLFRFAVTGVVLAAALTTSARAGYVTDPVGPYDADKFSLRQGAAARSLTPAAAWYFKGQRVAVPAGGTVSTDGPPGANPPDGAFPWFPGPDRLAGLQLDSDGTLRREDGTAQPYALAPKPASDRSYYDASSTRYLQRRTLSMRGAFNRPAEAVPRGRDLRRTNDLAGRLAPSGEPADSRCDRAVSADTHRPGVRRGPA